MATPENTIGVGGCPLCGGTTARFTLTKSGLCCMNCNRCNCQIFARSGTSDEKLRGFIAPPPATATPVNTVAPPRITPPNLATPMPPKVGFGLIGAW